MRCLYLSLSRRISTAKLGGSGTHMREVIGALGRLGVDVVRRIDGDVTHQGAAGSRHNARSRAPGLVRDVGLLVRDLRRLTAGAPIDVIYERWTYMQTRGIRLARRLGVPHVLEVNAPPEEIRDFFGSPLLPVARARLARVLRETDAVVAVSGALRDHLVAMGADPERTFALHNGASQALFADAAASEPTLPGTTVAYLGSFGPWNGVELLVEAFARAVRGEPGLRLLLAGSGTATGPVRDRARRLGIASRLQLVETFRPQEGRLLLARADIAVVPHCEWYMSPVKLFEYGAGGRAVVAPRVPSLTEVLVDGETAALFEPGSPGALAQAIIRLARDPDLRRALGAAWHAAVRERHSWDHVGRRILQILQDVTAKGR